MYNGHIIQKQFLDVIANQVEDGFAMQRETERLYRQRLLPGLEKLLDIYGPIDEVLSIDQLYVEVDNLNPSNFEAEFSTKILQKLEMLLKDAVKFRTKKNPEESIVPIIGRLEKLLIHYLDEGFLPWWGKIRDQAEWKEALSMLLSAPNTERKWDALKISLRNEISRKRFQRTFSSSEYWELIHQLYRKDKSIIYAIEMDMKLIIEQIDREEQRTKVAYLYKDLITRFVIDVISYKVLCESLYELMTISPLKRPLNIIFSELRNPDLRVAWLKHRNKEPRQRTSKNELSDSIRTDEHNTEPVISNVPVLEPEVLSTSSKNPKFPTEEIYLTNSGLVILAPFLPRLFANRQLVEDEKLIDPSKGVAFLNYLVYGDYEYEEFECVLSKVFCGLRPEEVVLNAPISDEDRLEGDSLLESVISHWQVLKNTSASGLRQSFLQREGRLIFTNNEWQLIVQKESHDVLLAHLPWNINMIKLPWMTHLLQVEWT